MSPPSALGMALGLPFTPPPAGGGEPEPPDFGNLIAWYPGWSTVDDGNGDLDEWVDASGNGHDIVNNGGTLAQRLAVALDGHVGVQWGKRPGGGAITPYSVAVPISLPNWLADAGELSIYNVVNWAAATHAPGSTGEFHFTDTVSTVKYSMTYQTNVAANVYPGLGVGPFAVQGKQTQLSNQWFLWGWIYSPTVRYTFSAGQANVNTTNAPGGQGGPEAWNQVNGGRICMVESIIYNKDQVAAGNDAAIKAYLAAKYPSASL